MLVGREALGGGPSASRPGCDSLACANKRHRRTSTTVPAAGWIMPCYQRLTGGEWIKRHQDLLVTSPTETYKTWLSCALGHRACRDNRFDRTPTIVTRQAPTGFWHEHIGNPTIAGAVPDRLVHGTHRLDLKGENMRKLQADKTRPDGATALQANSTRSQHNAVRSAGFPWNRRLARIGNTG